MLLFGMGCGTDPRHVNNSFYYWRSTFRLADSDTEYLRAMSIDRLYIRFFDVGWHDGADQPYPIAPVQFATLVPPGIEVVPTVFIENDVLRRLDERSSAALALSICAKIQRITESMRRRGISQIQIDCDWTATTRDTYFGLLRKIAANAKASGWSVSATIRLHQIKYRRTAGVPPVDRGMLMAYNVGQPAEADQQNAIFNADEVMKYLGELDSYPLSLDVALPLFSWGVVFHENEFLVLIGNLRHSDLVGNKGFTRQQENWYLVAAETYLNGHHLFAGDRIRIEEVDPDDRATVARAIAARTGHDSISVALFHFDPTILKHHERAEIQDLYRDFN